MHRARAPENVPGLSRATAQLVPILTRAPQASLTKPVLRIRCLKAPAPAPSRPAEVGGDRHWAPRRGSCSPSCPNGNARAGGRLEAPPIRHPHPPMRRGPSRLAGEGTLRVEAGEAAKGPDGEDVPVARVVDGTGLVEDTSDVLLKEYREIHTKGLPEWKPRLARWTAPGESAREPRRATPCGHPSSGALPCGTAPSLSHQLLTAVPTPHSSKGGAQPYMTL